MKIKTVGSICSGIEAASVAWNPLKFKFEWFSEIADFPSSVLAGKYPNTINLGNMNEIPNKILNEEINAPDLICGGTPCQAFSLAGNQNGLNDDRGNLTLKFVDIINANDNIRIKNGQKRTVVFWENVEGVLTDKTNAFGCLVSSLAGLDSPIEKKRWTTAFRSLQEITYPAFSNSLIMFENASLCFGCKIPDTFSARKNFGCFSFNKRM